MSDPRREGHKSGQPSASRAGSGSSAACACGQRHTTWTNDKDVSNEGHSVACPANPQFAKPSAAYLPAGEAPSTVLVDRVAVAMIMPHNHPGIAGRADGNGCPRCNAEHALRALFDRAEDMIDFTPSRPRWRVLRGGKSAEVKHD